MSVKSPEKSERLIDKIRHRYGNAKLLRVWPEWSSPALWAPHYIGATPVGAYIALDEIDISEGLKNRLIAWHDLYDAQPIPQMMSEIEKCAFDAEGLNIAIQLSCEVDGGCIVEYELGDQNLLIVGGACVCIFQRPPPPANP
jgi:hypothetical protein